MPRNKKIQSVDFTFGKLNDLKSRVFSVANISWAVQSEPLDGSDSGIPQN